LNRENALIEPRPYSGASDVDERFRLLADLAPIGILLRGANLECTYVNASWLAITGLTRSQALGPGWLEAIHPEDRERLAKAQREAIRTASSMWLELRYQRPGGEVRWVQGRTTPLRRADHTVTSYLVVVEDMTERKKLEWALAETSSREQRRLGDELHDGLGQHLTGLALMASGLANAARSAALPNAADLDCLAALASEAITTCRTIAHGLSPLGDSRGALRAALRALVARHAAFAGRDVHFEEVGRAALRLGDGAADHLYRIAQEALNNALRHSGAQSIVVRLIVRRDVVRLEILDDGTGLSPSRSEVLGIGIHSMRHRAHLIEGELTIAARPGGGTAVICECRQNSLPSPAADL
jgi:PAS domain S-box-containing protein